MEQCQDMCRIFVSYGVARAKKIIHNGEKPGYGRIIRENDVIQDSTQSPSVRLKPGW